MSVSSFYSTDRAEEQTLLLKAILKELRRLADAQEKIAREGVRKGKMGPG